jgi:hypothetical protein
MTCMLCQLLILYVLAILDFGCSGLRTASGRSALLNKYKYFRDSIIHGILLGHILLILPVVALLLLLQQSQQQPQVIQNLERAMQGMFWVYIPYTMLFMFAMCVRWIPHVDFKSATSILILGPLTFIRPMVAIIGIAVAIFFSPHAELFALGTLAVFCMLSFEFFLDRLHNRRFCQKITSTLPLLTSANS